MVIDMVFDDDNFIHITDTVIYITYLDGNTLRNKLLGTAKSATFEKVVNYKYKSVIGGQGKPNILIPSLKIVKGSIDKFVVSSEAFDTNKNTKYVSFYNMMQGFKNRRTTFPEFNQYERSINLIFIHNDLNKTFQTTVNGVHATGIKRSFDDGFLVEKFEFIAYDMVDEVI